MEPLPDLIACVRAVVGLTQRGVSSPAEPTSPAPASGAAANEECTRVSCRSVHGVLLH